MEKQRTRIVPYSQTAIAEAKELLQNGKLVGFPTETVYGLGANACNAEACKLIFETKGRPLTDPLIVHVHSLDQALGLMDQSSEALVSLFKQLASKYWPGPLTLVVKSNPQYIPDLVTAGTGFVGLRMPNHPVALDLIKTSGLPIAAPSANKFGHVSPTKAEHVYDDFYADSEVFIIDGGACSFGIESTVLKISYEHGTDKPYKLLILRRGGVSEQSLQETIIELGFESEIELSAVKHKHFKQETEQLEAPGQFLRHYSPNIDSYLFKGLRDDHQIDLSQVVLLDFGGLYSDLSDKAKHYLDLSAKADYNEAINVLYDALRWAETREDAKLVLITHFLELDESLKNKEGLEHRAALFDRVFRATSGREI